MRGRGDDLLRAADDHRSPFGMELLQSIGEQWNVGGADLEETVTTE